VIRVLIAAHSAVVRAGLEAIVRSSPELELAGASDPENLEPAVEREQPDVVLVDLELPGDPDPPTAPSGAATVFLSDHPPGAWTAEAFRAGARAVLPRAAAAPEILAAIEAPQSAFDDLIGDAIEAAANGLVVLSPGDLQALLPFAARAERRNAAAATEALTTRENEVFTMLAEGAGNKVIAWKLGISEHTVKFHVASIMGKLHATSRTEAVAIGIRKGLILL
jgi:two-component system, NarL family, response regulator YdfI